LTFWGKFDFLGTFDIIWKILHLNIKKKRHWDIFGNSHLKKNWLYLENVIKNWICLEKFGKFLEKIGFLKI
jgi:hypothetical protein